LSRTSLKISVGYLEVGRSDQASLTDTYDKPGTVGLGRMLEIRSGTPGQGLPAEYQVRS